MTEVLGALDGVRVVDLTQMLAGPYCTMLLADQGAEIIKVEAPEGDAVRHIGKPGKTPGMGPTYLYVNRNKRSLCLDLKDPAAKAALLKVVARADAFVHALRLSLDFFLLLADTFRILCPMFFERVTVDAY